MLSITTSGVRLPDRLARRAVTLLNLVLLEREDFCLHYLFTNKRKSSLWFLSLMLCPVESRNSGIQGNPEKSLL